MTPEQRVPRVIAAFFALDFLVIGLHPLLRSIESLPPGLRQLVNLNREGNLPTWFSSMQWLCVAALLLALSVDEDAQIHERLGLHSDRMLPTGAREDGPFHRTGIWMFVVGIPVLAVFAILIRSAGARLRRAPGAFLRFAIGMGLVALGAMGFDLLTNLFADSVGDWRQVAEEGLEMFGATVVLWGSHQLLHAHGLRFGLQLD